MQWHTDSRTNRTFSREDGGLKPSVIALRQGDFDVTGTYAGDCEFRMKCANPQCSRTFRQQYVGRVFRLRIWPAGAYGVPDFLLRYFWLCGSCSSTFTLVFDERRGVSLAPLHYAADHEAESRLILEVTAAHFRKHDTGRIGNEHGSGMETELNDTKEAHHGRRTIFTRKTRSRR